MANGIAASPLKKTRSNYFGRIKNAVLSILEGMSVTFGYLLQRPITVQYPDKTPKPVKETLPERYRGILDVQMNICTACLACERACPIDCIKIEVVKEKETKKRYLTHFYIDLSKCMYCGLCTEQCPTEAIRHTCEFEASTVDVRFLVKQYVTDGPVEPYKPPKKEKKDAEEETKDA